MSASARTIPAAMRRHQTGIMGRHFGPRTTLTRLSAVTIAPTASGHARKALA